MQRIKDPGVVPMLFKRVARENQRVTAQRAAPAVVPDPYVAGMAIRYYSSDWKFV